jgi:hypothetical protein
MGIDTPQGVLFERHAASVAGAATNSARTNASETDNLDRLQGPDLIFLPLLPA